MPPANMKTHATNPSNEFAASLHLQIIDGGRVTAESGVKHGSTADANLSADCRTTYKGVNSHGKKSAYSD